MLMKIFIKVFYNHCIKNKMEMRGKFATDYLISYKEYDNSFGFGVPIAETML